MLDNKGNLIIIDAVVIISLLFIVLMTVNMIISIPEPVYSDTIRNSQDAQDVMQTLSGKVNFTDGSFLADISNILIENDNSKESLRTVSDICKNKFESLNIKNYKFSETNVLNNKVLSYSGDYSSAANVTVASRMYGDYYYTLSVW